MVCQTCYTAILRSPAGCARCNISQPLIGRDGDGAGVCGPCAGVDIDYTCRQCGRSGNPYGRGRCARCVLAERVRDLLAGPGDVISPQLHPLAEALAQSETPFETIQWIKQSPTARMLARLAAGDQPMSHLLLDELPPDRKLHYIRQIMVQTGVLPERHEDLERLPSWLDHHLAGTPAGTPASSARSCTGSCCAGPAAAPLSAASRPRPAGTCAAGSWSPLTCWPGSMSRNWH